MTRHPLPARERLAASRVLVIGHTLCGLIESEMGFA